jgi:hypothetical protein
MSHPQGPPPPAALKLARWTKKTHVTPDGITSACGFLIPERATVTRGTAEWYLHTDCYNCTYRLWPQYGPADYICPTSGKDFPRRRSARTAVPPAGA